MIAIKPQMMTAEEALTMASQMVKMRAVEKMTGISDQLLSYYKTGQVQMPAEKVSVVNEALHTIGEQMMQTRVTEEDTLSQVKLIGKTVLLPYIFTDRMGMTTRQMKMRISDKREKVYGQFTQKMIIDINAALVAVGMQLLQIKICDEPQETTT